GLLKRDSKWRSVGCEARTEKLTERLAAAWVDQPSRRFIEPKDESKTRRAIASRREWKSVSERTPSRARKSFFGAACFLRHKAQRTPADSRPAHHLAGGGRRRKDRPGDRRECQPRRCAANEALIRRRCPPEFSTLSGSVFPSGLLPHTRDTPFRRCDQRHDSADKFGRLGKIRGSSLPALDRRKRDN